VIDGKIEIIEMICREQEMKLPAKWTGTHHE
jgi:hypothetical protein